MTEPSSAPDTTVNWLAIGALVVGVLSIFFNLYLLVSVIAVVLGIIALVRARAAGNQRTSRVIAILGIIAGVVGALLVIVSNTISTMS